MIAWKMIRMKWNQVLWVIIGPSDEVDSVGWSAMQPYLVGYHDTLAIAGVGGEHLLLPGQISSGEDGDGQIGQWTGHYVRYVAWGRFSRNRRHLFHHFQFFILLFSVFFIFFSIFYYFFNKKKLIVFHFHFFFDF